MTQSTAPIPAPNSSSPRVSGTSPEAAASTGRARPRASVPASRTGRKPSRAAAAPALGIARIEPTPKVRSSRPSPAASRPARSFTSGTRGAQVALAMPTIRNSSRVDRQPLAGPRPGRRPPGWQPDRSGRALASMPVGTWICGRDWAMWISTPAVQHRRWAKVWRIEVRRTRGRRTPIAAVGCTSSPAQQGARRAARQRGAIRIASLRAQRRLRVHRAVADATRFVLARAAHDGPASRRPHLAVSPCGLDMRPVRRLARARIRL